MHAQYNPYNFEASFRIYLLSGNVSSVTLKNYLSDLRHFAGWLTTVQKHCTSFDNLEELKAIPPSMVESYCAYLIEAGVPTATVNRRLSTLRKFFSFCISQGWIDQNPAKHMSNISKGVTSLSQPLLVKNYRDFLLNKGLNSNDIDILVTDVNELLTVS
jgi:site-specific recombinase XerD